MADSRTLPLIQEMIRRYEETHGTHPKPSKSVGDYTILDSTWFTCGDGVSIGMVAIKKGEGWKCYMGLASGANQGIDEQAIAALGAGVSEEMARSVFNISLTYIY